MRPIRLAVILTAGLLGFGDVANGLFGWGSTDPGLFAPTIALVAFMNSTGSLGTAMPDSAAWSE